MCKPVNVTHCDEKPSVSLNWMEMFAKDTRSISDRNKKWEIMVISEVHTYTDILTVCLSLLTIKVKTALIVLFISNYILVALANPLIDLFVVRHELIVLGELWLLAA